MVHPSCWHTSSQETETVNFLQRRGRKLPSNRFNFNLNLGNCLLTGRKQQHDYTTTCVLFRVHLSQGGSPFTTRQQTAHSSNKISQSPRQDTIFFTASSRFNMCGCKCVGTSVWVQVCGCRCVGAGVWVQVCVVSTGVYDEHRCKSKGVQPQLVLWPNRLPHPPPCPPPHPLHLFTCILTQQRGTA